MSTTMSQATKTKIHIMALDCIVNVNFLFTIALFIGLSSNPSDPDNVLVTNATCAATSANAQGLVTSHVYSFSSFLFSSLVALGLKQAIRTAYNDHTLGYDSVAQGTGHVDLRLLQIGILCSGSGSCLGCVFLMLALLDLVQIKLGILACLGSYTLAAAIPLVTLIPSALVVYISIVFHAFTQ